jgi:hypothetical protein
MAMSPRLLRPRAGGVHPEAADWRSRVITNGGTVSASTLKAVDTFCKAISSAGIRDRFYRLNLFAGTGLSAALVPLYRNTSFSGSPLGNATDTNAGGVFVSGDYSESVGLTPTVGGAKHLDTGLTPDAMPLSVVQAMHLACSHGPIPAPASTVLCRMIGAANGGTDRHFLNVAVENSGTPKAGSPLGKVSEVASATLPTGAQPSASWISSRTSATSLVMYKNGASDGTLTTSVTGIASYSRAFTVCRVNFTGSIIGDSYNLPHRHYSIGAGLTASEAAAYDTALSAFRTALGRTA